ncbi:MAG: ATP-binding protein, partial [Kiritimatiellae bacterium]|nr:ATP-binding protein [Kiritimatiellia bacterium]
MTAKVNAKAYPRKHFFVEMFTRDISLIDCMLDLVDNSVDGLIRSQKIDLGAALLTPHDATKQASSDLHSISMDYSDREFSIHDNCGGIGLQDAKNETFNFGHSHDYHENVEHHQLGVYGVGLKRAIFKLGKIFQMTSRTKQDGFNTKVDLDDWVQKDESLKDWTFPLTPLLGVQNAAQAGTKIKISDLREEVRAAITDPTFESRLHKSISQAYALFLHKYVSVRVGKHDIPPIPIPFGASNEVTPASATFTENGVKVFLFASIASRSKDSHWTQDQAGWYVACNGRLVVTADKSELTGWGTGALPAFHSKYRGFVGLALFQSDSPLKLPWKTTKRGLNQEALIYQKARNQMNATARPILSFLDRMYPTEA